MIDWFYASVKSVYELNLMNGRAEGLFYQTKTVTIAELVTMLARIHSIYSSAEDAFTSGMPMYQSYVDYCTSRSLIPAAVAGYEDAEMNPPICRRWQHRDRSCVPKLFLHSGRMEYVSLFLRGADHRTASRRSEIASRHNWDPPLDNKIEGILEQIFTDDMTTSEKVKACYDYFINYYSYGFSGKTMDYIIILYNPYM